LRTPLKHTTACGRGVTVNDAREFQTETLPKNGPDALEMGCLYYPRKQTSVSYAADCDIIICYGGAKPTDKHLASTVHCVDDEIIGDCAAWIETIPDGRYCLRDLRLKWEVVASSKQVHIDFVNPCAQRRSRQS
jgi:hypothetical protein